MAVAGPSLPSALGVWVACATARPGSYALLRCAGEGLRDLLCACLGSLPPAWQSLPISWPLAGGHIPAHLLWCPAGRSFTGEDLAELTVPGSAALVDCCIDELLAQGAELAPPGYFARRALACGRLRLDQAEALLALVHATDAPAAQRALALLRGSLGNAVEAMRSQLLHLRALVEAGLDFFEEEDVQAYEPDFLRDQLRDIAQGCRSWTRAAASQGAEPLVILAGPSNVGKSTLFNALCSAQALVSAEAGSTRDWLEAVWQLKGRPCRLIDTAGWLDTAQQGLNQRAIDHSLSLLKAASLVLWCSTPEQPLPSPLPPIEAPCLHLSLQADRFPEAPRQGADLWLSAHSGQGMADLSQRVAASLLPSGALPLRQKHLLARAGDICAALAEELPADELLAADLRLAADCLAELLGRVSNEEVLQEIFNSFCIGK